MMNKKTKTPLLFILAGIFMVSFGIAACNNGSESKEATKDTMATEKSMEAAPATQAKPDTAKRDTASTRPVIPGN